MKSIKRPHTGFAFVRLAAFAWTVGVVISQGPVRAVEYRVSELAPLKTGTTEIDLDEFIKATVALPANKPSNRPKPKAEFSTKAGGGGTKLKENDLKHEKGRAHEKFMELLGKREMDYFYDGVSVSLYKLEEEDSIMIACPHSLDTLRKYLAWEQGALSEEEFDSGIRQADQAHIIVTGPPRMLQIVSNLVRALSGGVVAGPKEQKPPVFIWHVHRLKHAYAEDIEFVGSNNQKFAIPGILPKIAKLAGMEGDFGSARTALRTSPPDENAGSTTRLNALTENQGATKSDLYFKDRGKEEGPPSGGPPSPPPPGGETVVTGEVSMPQLDHSLKQALGNVVERAKAEPAATLRYLRNLRPDVKSDVVAALGPDLVLVLAEALPNVLPPEKRAHFERSFEEAKALNEPAPAAPESPPVQELRETEIKMMKAREEKPAAAQKPKSTPGHSGKVAAQSLQTAVSKAIDDIELISVSNVRRAIFADASQNAIIMFDTAENIAFYERIIADLDQPLDMVEISVAIVDINTEATFDWQSNLLVGSAGQINGHNVSAMGGFNAPETLRGNLGKSVPAPGIPDVPPLGDSLATALAASSGLNLSSLVVGSSYRILNRIQTLETQGDARVLSRPSVITLDNVQALFDEQMVFHVPVQGFENSELFKINTGTMVRVLPHIVRKGDHKNPETRRDDPGLMQVRIAVHIEEGNANDTASPPPNTTNYIPPSFSKGTVTTEAVVPVGQSLLIGGRYRNQESSEKGNVPIVGRIPLLGLPFKGKSVKNLKYQRFFLITPKVINPDRMHEHTAERAHDVLTDGGQSFPNPAEDPSPKTRNEWNQKNEALILDANGPTGEEGPAKRKPLLGGLRKWINKKGNDR